MSQNKTGEITEGPMLTINYAEVSLDLYKYHLGWGTTYLLGTGISLKEKEVNLFRTFTNKEICAQLHIPYSSLMGFKRKLRKRGFLSKDGVLSLPRAKE